jgi:hypothetical protein
MHRHDQGLQEGCRWCDLDLLLRELAGDVGLANLERYMAIEFDVMRRADARYAELLTKWEAIDIREVR